MLVALETFILRLGFRKDLTLMIFIIRFFYKAVAVVVELCCCFI